MRAQRCDDRTSEAREITYIGCGYMYDYEVSWRGDGEGAAGGGCMDVACVNSGCIVGAFLFVPIMGL